MEYHSDTFNIKKKCLQNKYTTVGSLTKSTTEIVTSKLTYDKELGLHSICLSAFGDFIARICIVAQFPQGESELDYEDVVKYVSLYGSKMSGSAISSYWKVQYPALDKECRQLYKTKKLFKMYMIVNPNIPLSRLVNTNVFKAYFDKSCNEVSAYLENTYVFVEPSVHYEILKSNPLCFNDETQSSKLFNLAKKDNDQLFEYKPIRLIECEHTNMDSSNNLLFVLVQPDKNNPDDLEFTLKIRYSELPESDAAILLKFNCDELRLQHIFSLGTAPDDAYFVNLKENTVLEGRTLDFNVKNGSMCLFYQ